jgi:hypothetical protein
MLKYLAVIHLMKFYIQLQPIHSCFMECKDATAVSSGYLHCTYKVTHYVCLAAGTSQNRI